MALVRESRLYAGEHDVTDALGHLFDAVAAFGEMANELSDEERVAVGAVMDPARVGGAVEQSGHLVHRQPVDGHPLDVAVAAELRDRPESGVPTASASR